MKIAAIDYSITSPGIVIHDGNSLNGFKIETCNFYSLSDYDIPSFKNFRFKQHTEWKTEFERFYDIADWAMDCITDHDPDIVIMEGFSFGSKGRAVFSIAQNAGFLQSRLFSDNYEIQIVPPTVVKKFATGKGNSTKDQMYETFVTKTGFDLKRKIQPKRKLGSPTTDLVDAYFICEWAIEEYCR